jgi:hypothetical protein
MRYVILAIVLGCVPAFAQFSGRLSGTVLDSSGAPVPDATVGLYLSGGAKPLLATKTARDGAWHFIGVRATDYDITVESAGFAKFSLRGVTVDPANETDVPTITLKPASLNQSLDVVADAQKVETGNAEISDTIDVDQIQKLPVLDRDPLYLLQTLPGVVQQGNSDTTIDGATDVFQQHDAGRHQYPGQLHSRQRAGSHAEQNFAGADPRVHLRDFESERGGPGRGHAACFRDAFGH